MAADLISPRVDNMADTPCAVHADFLVLLAAVEVAREPVAVAAATISSSSSKPLPDILPLSAYYHTNSGALSEVKDTIASKGLPASGYSIPSLVSFFLS
jgi:hypothetical protein